MNGKAYGGVLSGDKNVEEIVAPENGWPIQAIFRLEWGSSFHHTFLVPPSQTCTTIGATIPRQCTIGKCARLQR